MTSQPVTRCAVVTGGTGGIGAAIAEGLARAGLRVIIIGRSTGAGKALADRLSQTFAVDVMFEQADLSARAEVQRLVGRISASVEAVDVLINCAAGVFEKRRTSVDGIEYTLALNRLGPMYMTLLLEPLLRNSQQARVIYVAADPGLLARQPPDPNDMEMQRGYSGVKAYMRSKNLNVISTYQLARRLADSRITVNAFHPGIVRTGLAGHLGAGKRFAAWVAGPFLLSPAEGADTGVWLATSGQAVGISGRFFVKRRQVLSAPCTYDVTLCNQLWGRSLTLLGYQRIAP